MERDHKRQLYRLYSLICIISVFWENLLFMVLSRMWRTGNYEFNCQKKSKNSKALYIKYFIFVIWIGAIITGYFINGFQQIDVTYGMTYVSVKKKVILTIGAIVLIAPLTAIFGQFASCKYICWQVPFMIIGTKIRDYFHFHGLRLKAQTEKCTNCTICSQKCPMNIDVMENVKIKEMNDIECILCGNCIDNCKQKVISFSFKNR